MAKSTKSTKSTKSKAAEMTEAITPRVLDSHEKIDLMRKTTTKLIRHLTTMELAQARDVILAELLPEHNEAYNQHLSHGGHGEAGREAWRDYARWGDIDYVSRRIVATVHDLFTNGHPMSREQREPTGVGVEYTRAA